MEKVLAWLDGKKTIISSVALFIVGGMMSMGFIDQKTGEALLSFIGALLGISIRMAIAKIE